MEDACARGADVLLILDLDETLVFATDAPLPGRAPDLLAGPYSVYKRPHLDAFLAGVRLRFGRVAVWTSSSAGYAEAIVRQLFPDGGDWLAFVWSAGRCTPRRSPDTDEWVSCKPLRKVRRVLRADLSRVIVVDDSPEKWRASYGNLVRVRPFEGDPADDELPALLGYLDALRHAHDVRRVEKRNWRRFPAPPSGTGGPEPS